MKVGFIGLGHMGGPMSRNVLAAGHDLTVHDIRREAAAELEADGATWAATRKALENGATGAPKLDEILAARHEPANPFFTAGLSRTGRVSSDSLRTEHVR